jgi:preprotein translocase subunit SecG
MKKLAGISNALSLQKLSTMIKFLQDISKKRFLLKLTASLIWFFQIFTLFLVSFLFEEQNTLRLKRNLKSLEKDRITLSYFSGFLPSFYA